MRDESIRWVSLQITYLVDVVLPRISVQEKNNNTLKRTEWGKKLTSSKILVGIWWCFHGIRMLYLRPLETTVLGKGDQVTPLWVKHGETSSAQGWTSGVVRVQTTRWDVFFGVADYDSLASDLQGLVFIRFPAELAGRGSEIVPEVWVLGPMTFSGMHRKRRAHLGRTWIFLSGFRSSVPEHCPKRMSGLLELGVCWWSNREMTQSCRPQLDPFARKLIFDGAREENLCGLMMICALRKSLILQFGSRASMIETW